jgi:hypothetical protein
MAGNKVTVTVEGDPKDKGHARLVDFLKELEALRSALKHTERIITGHEAPSVYYRIVDLKHHSPATVVLEAVPIEVEQAHAEEVVGTFFRALAQIRETKKVPKRFDLAALEAYRELTTGLKGHLSSVSISNGAAEVPINEDFEQAIIQVIGPDEFEQGFITGTMEQVNLHNTSQFVIYPVIGPKRVRCDFPVGMLERVKAAIGNYVGVSGQLRFKTHDPFPYAINVDQIEIYPPDEQLPTLYDIRGIAPDATGGIGAYEFVRRLRDASW